MILRLRLTSRWFAAWLIAALLCAQHGALGHALTHLDAERAFASAGVVQDDGLSGHELACAKCLAYAVLDHAAASSPGAEPVGTGRAALQPNESVCSLSQPVPAACSRDPPSQFS